MSKEDLRFFGLTSVIGALTGCILSFTTLQPSAAGGGVGLAPIAVMYIRSVLNEGVPRNKKIQIELGIAAITAIAVGVTIGAVADSNMSNTWLATLVGTIIGTTATVAGDTISSIAGSVLKDPESESLSISPSFV
ncbi:Hypothetical protein CINCED_3A011241 [Cinara cedri]|uniref:Uncharacterized protein n=1 Tax=Cinara cedri TaxID=506608 RepID=A0A5E4N0W6_9HEMI|nr:Hypothetical protein CINCED_3A011241 [Cinara cedri]